MLAMKQNVSQLALIKCQWVHKMHDFMCWPMHPMPVRTKNVSECDDQTPALPAVTQNESQHVLSKRIPWKGSTQNVSEHVFIKFLLCQRGNKMHPNMCWPNPSHASKDWKNISTCVQKIRPMKSMTQNSFQHVLTKTLSCQQGHKIHLNMFWPKLSYVSEGTKLTSTCVEQTYPMPERTQTGTHHVLNKHNIYQWDQKNESQHVLTNPIPCQQGIIMNQSEDGKCMSTCVEQNPLMPART